ncbi:hypothetical protein KYC_22451 [Achromobacter arsenitoxydans SY8]|uniref:Uncharacterized protein n=1 Tax=Achromobacter arsenitoxydans SY8 TaxID=477184 RepID=H0FCI1_9BURK|nr:hypothetical protein KYC_22451 [Achromobacter arsenitoxydans SY8]
MKRPACDQPAGGAKAGPKPAALILRKPHLAGK